MTSEASSISDLQQAEAATQQVDDEQTNVSAVDT